MNTAATATPDHYHVSRGLPSPTSPTSPTPPTSPESAPIPAPGIAPVVPGVVDTPHSPPECPLQAVNEIRAIVEIIEQGTNRDNMRTSWRLTQAEFDDLHEHIDKEDLRWDWVAPFGDQKGIFELRMARKVLHEGFRSSVGSLLVERANVAVPSVSAMNAGTSQVRLGKSMRSPDAQLRWVTERFPTVVVEVNHRNDLNELLKVKSPLYIKKSRNAIKTVIIFDLEKVRLKSGSKTRLGVGSASYSFLRSFTMENGKRFIENSEWQLIRDEDKNLCSGSLTLVASDMLPPSILETHPDATVTITHKELFDILEDVEAMQQLDDDKLIVKRDYANELKKLKLTFPQHPKKRTHSTVSASSSSDPEFDAKEARKRKDDKTFAGGPKPADGSDDVGLAKGRAKREGVNYGS